RVETLCCVGVNLGDNGSGRVDDRAAIGLASDDRHDGHDIRGLQAVPGEVFELCFENGVRVAALDVPALAGHVAELNLELLGTRARVRAYLADASDVGFPVEILT